MYLLVQMAEILQVSLAFWVWIWSISVYSEIVFQERIKCDMRLAFEACDLTSSLENQHLSITFFKENPYLKYRSEPEKTTKNSRGTIGGRDNYRFPCHQSPWKREILGFALSDDYTKVT